MKRLLAAAFSLFLIVSCEKNDDPNPGVELPNGLYVGSFHRSGMDSSEVTLNLFEGKFEGSSSRDTYPAICGGTFSTTESFIEFQDSCAWTANFDWSLILTGRYNVDFENNTLRIWKTTENRTDEYYLHRLVR